MDDEERDELLIRLDERTATLVKGFASHVKHHWIVSMLVGSILLGLLVTLLT